VGNGVKKPGGGYCDDGRLPPDVWEVPELGGKKATQEIVCAVCRADHNGLCVRKENKDETVEACGHVRDIDSPAVLAFKLRTGGHLVVDSPWELHRRKRNLRG
jgi:hypothetical protein